MTDSLPPLKPEDTTPAHVLVVVAHPDDIEFGCAGSLARWIAAGAQATYALLTDGSAGSDDPDMTPEKLAAIREIEQRAAAAVIGVSDLRFFRQVDGQLVPSLDLRRELVRLIREVRPDRIVLQDPTTVYVREDYINHPDHRAAGQVALDSIFPASQSRLAFFDLLAEGYEPHTVHEVYLMLTQQPDTYVDISESIEQKIEALLCHRSQLDEDAAKWARERNSEIGQRAGVAYAEQFRVMKINQRRAGNNPGREAREATRGSESGDA